MSSTQFALLISHISVSDNWRISSSEKGLLQYLDHHGLSENPTSRPVTNRLLISMVFQGGSRQFLVSGHCRRKGQKDLTVQHEQVSRPIPTVKGAGKVEAALAVASRYLGTV